MAKDYVKALEENEGKEVVIERITENLTKLEKLIENGAELAEESGLPNYKKIFTNQGLTFEDIKHKLGGATTDVADKFALAKRFVAEN